MEKAHVICKLRKALYSTLQAAYLFWKLLSDMLIEWTDMKGTSKTPVVNQLFITQEICYILRHGKAQLFHHLEMKILYLCWCTRQEMQYKILKT